VDATPVADRW